MLTNQMIKNQIGQELEPKFTGIGFNVIPGNELLFCYQREEDGIFQGVDGYLLKYNDFKLVYRFEFGIQAVVQVLREIDKHVPLRKTKYEISNCLVGVSPGGILFPLEPERPYKDFADELQLQSILFDIQAFYLGYYQTFVEKYKDLSRLNLLFNRLDDFVIKPSGFPNLAFFHITRLVLARMANDPNFEEIVERNFQALEELWKAQGAVYDRTDSSKPEVFAAEYLRSSRF